MYLRINTIKTIEPLAEEFVFNNDRMLYKPFFERAEQFCSDNNVLIGGPVGVHMLIKKEINKDLFVWDLYCDDIFQTSKNLATALSEVKSPHVPSRTVALQTNIRHKEFTIFVYTRMLFKIYSLDKYRGVKLSEMMCQNTTPGYFTQVPIKCICAEMQLIETYRILYTPAKMAMWQAGLDIEDKLFAVATGPASDIKGGREQSCDYQKVLVQLLTKSPHVLIGDHALSDMGLITNPARIQIISSDDIEIIRTLVEKTICNQRTKINQVKYSLNIPSDFQITKHTLYITSGKDQTPIMDVFNSSQFEMIPYYWGRDKYAGVRIGNPWVILRFLFIDIWVLKLIMRMSGDAKPMKCKISTNVSRAALVRKFISTRGPTEAFQLSNYAGTYINETIAKKKLIKEIGDRFPMFYPAANKPSGGSDQLFQSTSIDITSNVENKEQLVLKITKKNDVDIMTSLANFKGTYTSTWGIGKSIQGVYRKNAHFMSLMSKMNINTYVDIGCGSGLDVEAFRQKFNIRNAICADIDDFRTKGYQNNKFVKITLNEPLSIEDGTVDLVTMFHVIHHIEDDLQKRLDDVARVVRKGGMVFIKDHDVRTKEVAENVDFEHLIYLVGEMKKGSINDLLTDFNKHLPMYYYSSDKITEYMSKNFELVWMGDFRTPLTCVYSAAFRKK